MFRRILILLVALMGIAASWVVSISLLIVLIFTQRHPDHCMAEYYNFFLPARYQVSCEGE